MILQDKPQIEKFYLNKNEELTPLILYQMINKHEFSNKDILEKWLNYYNGFQDILEKSYPDTSKPCNKLVINFCKNIVNSYLGYMAAPNCITYQSDNNIDTLFDTLKYNDYANEDIDFLRDALIFGEAHELMYIDYEANARFTTISPLESFAVYDNCLGGELLYFVRWYQANQWDNSDKYYVDVYNDKTIKHYQMYGELGNLEFIKEEPHYFSQCPANIFELENRESIFNCIITLQDAYNSILSDQNDDIDSFTTAILKFTGDFDMEVLEGQKDQITKSRQIFLPRNGANGSKIDVDFLTKPQNNEQAKDALERIKADIYRIAQCPDFSSESFTGGVSSGIAIRYRLTGMETKAGTIEAAMKKALQRRIEILCGFVSLKFGEEVYRDININFERNIPEDLSTVATAVSQLNGIVSDETLLSTLPFINNPQEEAKKVQEQKERNMSMYDFGVNDEVLAEENT